MKNCSKYIYLFFCCLLCWTCTLPDLPPEKKLACQKPTGIYASVDNQNPRKYTFGFLGNKEDVLSVVYSLNSTTIPETYTFVSDGSYAISALVTTNCQEKFTLTNTFTINTKPDILSGGFTLTDPKVLSNAQTLAVTNKGEIVTNDDNIIKVWNLQSNMLVRSINFQFGIPNTIALTPDEKYLFVASSQYIMQYDFNTGGFIKQINAHSGSIYDLAISGDGKILVSSSNDKTVKTWDISTGNSLKSITIDNTSNFAVVFDVAINFDGSKIVGDLYKYDGSKYIDDVVVWNAINGAEIYRFVDQNASVNYVAMNKSGKLIYFNYSNNSAIGSTIKIIDTETKQIIKDINANYTSLAISPDDKYVVTGEQLINASNYTQSWYKFRHINFLASNVAFSSNGNYIGSLSRREGTMALATLDGIETIQNRTRHEGFITSVNFSKDGNASIVFDASGKAKFWDLATKIAKYTIGTENVPNSTLMNDNYIAGGYYNSFKVWNKSNGSIKYQVSLGSRTSDRIANSNDNKIFIVPLSDGEIRVLEAETGKTLFSLAGVSGAYPLYSGTSPDSKRIITSTIDKKIKIWDATNGTIIKTLDVSSLVNNTNNLYVATLSPDGNNLAIVYNDNGYKILNYSIALESRSSQFNINTYVQSLDFSKDGKDIVVGNGSKTVQIYNVQTGILQKERVFENDIVNVAYNPSGTQIYVTTKKDFQIISAK